MKTTMKFIKSFFVKKNSRGILLKDGNFHRILNAGKNTIIDFNNSYSAQFFDYDNLEIKGDLAGELFNSDSSEFISIATGEKEIALLYKDTVLTEIIVPSSRRLFFKNIANLEFKKIAIPDNLEIDDNLIASFGKINISNLILGNIEYGHIGLLSIDGKFIKSIPAGKYGFYGFFNNIIIRQIDLRAQLLDVSGQEILTRDKVSLRLNLSAVWQFKNAELAFLKMNNPTNYVYSQLQFALRQAVGQKTLDELLEDKSAIDAFVMENAASALAEIGVELSSAGVKDIILSGDMREILSQVVQAEKAAQANVVKRREETAATRSLLNTAKVMESNPIALRMKELETLERVAERIDKISVVGGLDSVLNGLIKIN